MIKLRDVSILDLLPPNLLEDEDVVAIALALDIELKAITKAIEETKILSRIDELPEPVIDHLLWQFHVTYEEGAGLATTIEEKKELVKNAIKTHKKKGTKGALKRILNALNMQCLIEEWFEYGGQPGEFRIKVLEISTRGLNEEQLNLIDKLVDAYKNARSIVESIKIYLTSYGKQYLATTMQTGEEITVYPWKQNTIQTIGMASFGSTSQSIEIVTIYPQ